MSFSKWYLWCYIPIAMRRSADFFQGYEATVLAFISNDDIQWIVYLGSRRIRYLIVKHIFFWNDSCLYHIQGPLSSNLFGKLVWSRPVLSRGVL